MIPSDGRVLLPVTSPTSAAFPKRFGGSAYPNLPHKETLCGMSFEIVAIPYVQLRAVKLLKRLSDKEVIPD